MSITQSTITFDLSTVPEHDRARVAALIPDPRLAEAYVHRSIKGFEDFDILDVAVEEAENVMLAGPTGSAKTTMFRAYAASRGLPIYIVDSNGAMDPGVILGKVGPRPDGTIGWIDGDMTLVIRYGGLVVIDEINLAHPRIQAAWHQLLSVARRMSIPEAGETIIAGRGGTGAPQPVLFGSAYNPRYQGTVRLNEAMRNRFAAPIRWGYDREVEEQLVTSTRLLDTAANIRSLAEIRSPLSTNMLMELERHASRFNMALAIELLVNHFEDDEVGPVTRALEAQAAAIATELGLNYEAPEVEAEPDPDPFT